MLVIAQAVVRQRFDNSALANLSGTAFSYYATQLSLHALQATNTLLNPSQVLARQGVNFGTGSTGIGGHSQQAADIREIEAQLSGMTDEQQAPTVGVTIAALITLRTCWLRHQPFAFIVPDQADCTAGITGQFSDGGHRLEPTMTTGFMLAWNPDQYN
jgi:hypothetical protein